MKKIRVYLTFDYELPLGGVKKNYKHSLFDPTNRLFDLAKKIDFPITLFADILSYQKFKEWDVPEYYKEFEEQMQTALINNHDVQLHLHPHWIDTKFKKNTFIPDSKFALSDFINKKSPNDVEGIVKNGYDLLDALCKKTDKNHKIIAYRAGGYNLYPQTQRILKALYNNGIKVDSSISRGYFFKSDFSLIDYRKTPNKPNWYLDFKEDFSKESSQGIYEVPIASKPKSIFEKPTKFKLKKLQYRAVENRGKMMHISENVQFVDKIKQALSSRMLTVDNHTYSHEYLMDILNYNIQKYKNFETIDLSLIAHPKSMGDYSFELLEEFVKGARAKYKNQIEFTTFKSVF
jgi:hypothetical protein